MIPYFSCDDVAFPLPDGHRFPATKYRLLREALTSRGLVNAAWLQRSPAASWEDLALVHTPEYLSSIRNGSLSAAALRRIGFPWSPELVERSRRSTGGTVAAALAALSTGAAANLAGGTHHAFADHGEGYCVFNDVAVAIRVLRRQKPLLRAAIVDLDVHQGNGNAGVFAADPITFTLSLHGRRNFPFRKEKSSLDVELEDHCDDANYLAALDRALPRVAAFRPEIVFFIAGSDILASDSLGLLDVSISGLEARDARVLDLAASLGAPVVMVMGGGYSRPIALSVAGHVASFEALARFSGRTSDQ